MSIALGYGLITCQRVPDDPRSDEEIYAQALDLAVHAEELGFDSVWVSEHHFVDDGYLPSLLPMCAAIAALTQRIAIGTGLLLAPLFEPIRLAEDAAVVDLISRGRLVLGLGLGWRDEEFEVLGVPLRERVGRLEDTIAVLRQAWAGEPVTGGPVVGYPAPYVTPGPSRPGGPPIWLGAISEPAVRRAGRMADGFMATDVVPSSFAEQVGWAREERSRAGLAAEGLAVGAWLPTYVYEGDADDAWKMILPLHHLAAWKYEDMSEARRRAGPPTGPPAIDAQTESALRQAMVFGTAAEVAEQILRFAESADGDLHYIARLYWPGMDLELQRRSMELFMGEVAPRLR